MDLTIIAGPLIGAVIGYFTNYLAVKMLFRPRREIKIGSKTLPFTPGVIPKGKPRLARVIGRTVADTLVTGEDIRKSLLSDSMQEAVADKAESILQSRLQTAVCRLTRWDDKEYETTKEKVCDKLSQEIYETVLQMPLQEKISESMLRYAQEKLAEMGGDGMMDRHDAPAGTSGVDHRACRRENAEVCERPRTGIHPPGSGTESR